MCTLPQRERAAVRTKRLTSGFEVEGHALEARAELNHLFGLHVGQTCLKQRRSKPYSTTTAVSIASRSGLYYERLLNLSVPQTTDVWWKTTDRVWWKTTGVVGGSLTVDAGDTVTDGEDTAGFLELDTGRGVEDALLQNGRNFGLA